MGSKKLIYMIGRKHGIIPFKARKSKLEYQRRGELEGLNMAEGVKRTLSIDKADIIIVRNKQQATTTVDRERIERKIRKYRGKKTIINDICYFEDYNSKERTFTIWKQNSIPVPVFEVLERNCRKDVLLERVNAFLYTYPRCILRTSNDEGGKGIFILDATSSQEQIHTTVQEFKDFVDQNRGLRHDGKTILVEYIHSSQNRYNNFCRAFCLSNRIVSLYCITSRDQVVHAKNMSIEDIHPFIEMNQNMVPELMRGRYKKLILGALNSLNIGMGAVDFLYHDDTVTFLEVNPVWGGKHLFGDAEFQDYLIEKREELESHIPLVYEIMDAVPFYKKFYESMAFI